MGRSIAEVNIGEILALAWNHPLMTGGLALMFTPPVFRVVIYFYPLLISTALCVVALVSAGQQIETTRKREIAGWNAKIVDGDHLSARLGVSATSMQTRVPAGQDNWLNRVHHFQLVGTVLNKEEIEGRFLNDVMKRNDIIIKEETLQRIPDEFRFVNEGPAIEFLDEDVLDRQIEAFREYERSLTFKRETEARASPSFTEGVIPFSPEEFNNSITDDWCAPKEIPPMVLYNLRTGGTGRRADDAKVNSEGSGAISSSFPFLPDESKKNVFSEDLSPPKAIPPVVFQTLRTGGTGRRDDDAKFYGGGGGAPNEGNNSLSHDVSTPKTIPPMVFHTLRTGGTDRGADAKVNNGGTGGAPAGSWRKEAVAELGFSSGRFDYSGSNLEKNVASPSTINKPDHRLEKEELVGGFTARAFQGKGESPVIGSKHNVASSASEKRSEKRAPIYTSPLRAFRGKEEIPIIGSEHNVASSASEERPEKRAPIYTSPLRVFRGKEESPIIGSEHNVATSASEKRPEKRAPIYTSPLRAFRGKEESPVSGSKHDVPSSASEKRPEKRAPIYTSPLRAFRGKEESPVSGSKHDVPSSASEKRPEKRAPIYTSPLRAFRGKEESPVSGSKHDVASSASEKRPEKRAPIYTSPLRAFRGKEESPVSGSKHDVASSASEKRPEKRAPIYTSPLRAFRGEERSPVFVSNTSNVVSSSPAKSRPEERSSSSLRRARTYTSVSRYRA